MSVKYSTTTADYLEWDTMLNLVRKLYKDGNYRMSLLIGCGCFFGLRISDILSLSWDMLLDGDSFTLIEKKTGKKRVIKINDGFQKHIKDCFKELNIQDKSEKCFISNKKSVYSVQRINVIFKEIKSLLTGVDSCLFKSFQKLQKVFHSLFIIAVKIATRNDYRIAFQK